jgi:hypothetical protein
MTELAGPELSSETLRRVCILFPPEDRERAKTLLYEQCGNNLPFLEKADMVQLDRFRFAALKFSDGSLPLLERAVNLAKQDWRDLLMATGFANDVEAHRRWEPKPAGEPAEIDPVLLAATIHDRLSKVLVPLGFERRGDTWRRGSEVPQALRVLTGLTGRTETKFFLQAKLEAKPVGVILHLPRLPAGAKAFFSEQGYVFRAGDSEEALYAAVMRDVVRYVQPWFQRFTSSSEVRRGFDEGTFTPHLLVESQALIF